MSPAKRYVVAPQGGGPPLLITSNSPLVSGEVGVAYSQTLQGTGGAPPYFWSLISGFFPTGLGISLGGVVSGTPSATGSSTVVLQIMDSRGARSPTKSFGITVVAAVTITTSTPLPAATQGSAYSQVIAASNGATPFTWSIPSQTGSNTWVIAPTTGNLTGTPANAETDSITVEVVDALGGISTRVFSLTVNASTVAATPTFSPAGGTYSVAQTVTISCTTPSPTIYYTTNGSTPTTSSTVYTGPITVSVTETVKAIATAAGFLQSAVGSATYTISATTGNYLGANISVLQSSPTEQPFLNIAKSSSSNSTNFTAWAASGSTTAQQIIAVVDSNGYMTSLPAGNKVTQFMNSAMNNQDPLGVNGSGLGNGLPPGATTLYPSGSYTLTFQGACTLIFSGDVTSGTLATSSANVSVSGLTITSTMTSTQTGIVTFTVVPSISGVLLNITALPSNTNYFRNHSIVRSSQLTAYNGGTIIDPNWVAMMTNNAAGGFKRLRFMGSLLMPTPTPSGGQLYQYQVPALTTGSSTTQTMTATWSGASGLYNCVLGSGSALDTAQNNTVTLVNGSATAVFTNAFTQSVTAGATNLWVHLFSGWSTRNQPGFAFWLGSNGNGTPPMIPYETCIAMANATNSDCWLNIPIWANSFTGQQAFWTSLAQLVQSNLNSGLKCYIELANEVPIEADEPYANMIAKTQLGTADFVSWMGLQTALISQAFQTVFGSSFASTIMIGPMTEFSTGNGVSFLEAMMNGPSIGGGTYPNSFLTNKPYTYFTHYGFAPYFPSGGLTAADWTTMLDVTTPLDDFFACMYGNVGTAANGSVTYSSVSTSGMAGSTIATIASIISAISSQPWSTYPVHCYEGGPNFGANGYTNAPGSYTGPYGGGSYTTLKSAMVALQINANRDVRMGYTLNDPTHQLSSNPGFLPAIISAGVTSMNYFDNCQFSSQFGMWGVLENVMQLPSSGGTGTATSLSKYAGVMDWIGGTTGATFDFYVSTTGSDSNAGTLAAPWAITSFQNTSSNNVKMISKRIGMIAGNYSTAGLANSAPTDFTACLMNIQGGSSSASTYIGSCNSAGLYTPRVAIITVPANTTITNGIMGGPGGQVVGKSSHITIDGIVINGNGLGQTNSAHIIQFYGTYSPTSSSAASETGILIQNCEFYGLETTTHSGGNSALIFFEGVFGSIVQNNYLHDASSTAPTDLGHMHAGEEYGCYNNQWIYNTMANCCSGLDMKNSDTGSVAAYNYLFNIGNSTSFTSSGVAFEGFDGYAAGSTTTGPAPINYLIHHNVLDTCYAVSIGDQTFFRLIAMNIYNNTVYDTTTGSVLGWSLNTNGASNLISYYNNIYFATVGSGNGVNQAKLTTGSAAGITLLDYNGYFQGSGTFTNFWSNFSTAESTLANWKTLIGHETNSISGTSPVFTGTITAGNGPNQFQLGSGSPCTGTGQAGVNIGAWDGTVTQIGANWVSYPIIADGNN